VSSTFFFAGGGTGGHIYPLMAVAEQILAREPDARIHFFHSRRMVDGRVFDKTPFERTPLPASGLSFRPAAMLRFALTFRQSYQLAKRAIAESHNPIVVGAGGFVAAPVCRAGRKLSIPVVLLNVDLLPGRANKLSARWANEIFTQFEESRSHFAHNRAVISDVGCPLRGGFGHPNPAKAIDDLGLHPDKNVLLITGASSGSMSINKAVCHLLPSLEKFADRWQIVHLTGLDNHSTVLEQYKGVQIDHTVLDYDDDMPDLLAAADLVVGRSGAVSVAEYAAAGVPSICIPYPHHKDKHQYRNAAKLVDASAAVIVDDVPDLKDRADRLWAELEKLMSDEERRRRMAEACSHVARPGAAAEIASRLLGMGRKDPAVINTQNRQDQLIP